VTKIDEALKRLSYSEIARRTKTTAGYISLLFRGERSARVETLHRVATALGVSMDELYDHLRRGRDQEASPDYRRGGKDKAGAATKPQRPTGAAA
jgi:transcriptional regulator with XRE-family HTH domain